MPTIRDNKLRIFLSALEMYSLIGGEFYVKNLKIPQGQPTDVKRHDTLYTDNNGEFNFRVGRHESSDVATWFNDKCNTTICTTFGHKAGRLNFAFLGTLRLNVSSKGKSKRNFTVEFYGILIAQGHKIFSNNWWFGGKHCFKVSEDNAVVSTGSAGNFDTFKVAFVRGGEEAEVYEVEISCMNYLTWMNNINGDKLLSDISIPGTHDSGTSNYDTRYFRHFLKTQDMTIRQQLESGIRFLDIRCRQVNDAFQIVHGGYDVGLTFEEVLDQCISFLKKARSESIILLVAEKDKPLNSKRLFYRTFLDTYVNKTSQYWYRGRQIPSLKDVRNKLFLLYRFGFYEDSFGINCIDWQDNTIFNITGSNYRLAIQDEYDVWESHKKRSIEEEYNLSKNKMPQVWYLNYISLSGSFWRGGVYQTAEYTNAIMDNIIKTEQNAFLGTVIMDFPETIPELILNIFESND